MWEFYIDHRELISEVLRSGALVVIGSVAGYAAGKARTHGFLINDIYNLVFNSEKRIKDLEFQVEHLSRFLQQKRQDSMAAAIKDATENPEKYLEGSYAIIKDDAKPHGA